MKALRQTVDLSAYPDLVVVYLGMRVNVLTGIKTLFGFGPKIEGSVSARPDGLLLHENLFYSLFPPHFGMRQYWRDFESLERWTRTGTGGSSFCETPGGLAFGMNSILSGVVLKRCMSTSNDRRAFSVLLIQYLRKAASSRLASDCTVAE